MTPDQVELEMLRKSAAKFMTDPLERIFFELESLVDNKKTNKIDSIMPANHFYILAKAVIELKRRLVYESNCKNL